MSREVQKVGLPCQQHTTVGAVDHGYISHTFSAKKHESQKPVVAAAGLQALLSSHHLPPIPLP